MAEQNESVKNASADGVDEGKFGQAGQLNPPRSPSGTGASQLRGSRQSVSAPTKERIFNPHAENPGRIPVAGGVAVGSRQFEQRRASRVSSDMGIGGKSISSEDGRAESSKDGALNGAASSPMFNMPDYANDAKSTEPTDTVDTSHPIVETGMGEAPVTDPIPESTDASTTEPGKETVGDDKSKTEKVKDTIKENVPNVSAAGSASPTSPSKARRGSRFDAFKEKLGIGKN